MERSFLRRTKLNNYNEQNFFLQNFFFPPNFIHKKNYHCSVLCIVAYKKSTYLCTSHYSDFDVIICLSSRGYRFTIVSLFSFNSSATLKDKSWINTTFMSISMGYVRAEIQNFSDHMFKFTRIYEEFYSYALFTTSYSNSRQKYR